MGRDEVLWWGLLGLTVGQSWSFVVQLFQLSQGKLVYFDGLPTYANLRSIGQGVAIFVAKRL